jgi:hypothetical protein
MGVFENVEVLGKSGADLESELLHHETGPSSEPGEGDASQKSDSSNDANQEPEAIDDDAQPPPESS